MFNTFSSRVLLLNVRDIRFYLITEECLENTITNINRDHHQVTVIMDAGLGTAKRPCTEQSYHNSRNRDNTESKIVLDSIRRHLHYFHHSISGLHIYTHLYEAHVSSPRECFSSRENERSVDHMATFIVISLCICYCY